MSRDAVLSRLVKQAERVIEAVTNDDSGRLVANQWVGGNGGLLSRDTIREVDKLRNEVNQWKTWWDCTTPADSAGVPSKTGE